jgi:hypothetical protein
LKKSAKPVLAGTGASVIGEAGSGQRESARPKPRSTCDFILVFAPGISAGQGSVDIEQD